MNQLDWICASMSPLNDHFMGIFVAATIGDEILLDHGTGVVIGETAVIGNRVSMMHVRNLILSS